MKEMRLLRELRHDNLNSFIGAVVEPLRVLILTDYCAKGSLYVSVMNRRPILVAKIWYNLIPINTRSHSFHERYFRSKVKCLTLIVIVLLL